MLMYIVAIRDSATEAFARPAFVLKPAEAVRSFMTECRRPSQPGEVNPLYDHPSDFELHQLGTYDDNTGFFTNDQTRLSRAVDCVA